MKLQFKLTLVIGGVALLSVLPLSYFSLKQSQKIILEKTNDVCRNLAQNISNIAREELFLDNTYDGTQSVISKLKESEITGLINAYIINVYGRFVVDMHNRRTGQQISPEELKFFESVSSPSSDSYEMQNSEILRFSFPVYLDESHPLRIGFAVIEFDQKILYAPVANIRNFIIYLSIGIFILVGMVSVLTSVAITKPISRLTEGAKIIGDGDYQHRIFLPVRDEIGSLATAFNDMTERIQKSDKLKNDYMDAYSRFVPQEFLKFLKKESILEIKLGDQIQTEMTVLFSDIRSFTNLSETMTPKENFDFLNAYLERVGPVIRKNKGFIDKYIGDAIMALFPYTPEDSIQACVEMHKVIRVYNEKRDKKGYKPIKIGVGIHTGNLMLGTIGENQRMDGTVIADAVNLASRIEGLTKMYGASTIISERTFFGLSDPDKYHYRQLDNVQVKGKKEVVSIFEILDGMEENLLKLYIDTKRDFEKGILSYQIQQFHEALECFNSVLSVNPGDIASQKYTDRCSKAIEFGISETWDGVERLSTK
ncbi:MAG TPA: adenylate/guanylate cyclase domain-containing protein [Leptospiraceae bacterium]|nr:adenylate/guanylate cyclase domain-containing protein [Leptospiraceae bacterium]HMY65666.1 adenylate/guanylate cyclase domain-containing protein [Leptospiraceae bacterium]HMZ57129.1 adenylate/guanylate cyclase domain-containing protein [Leptospiraceae bacterium]HNF12445.1 adenylate/guanylate cyclase domain-containing protein [Leptospiraceae bacterium]HNF23714.1 adenylate/guanylate cyclase domain-containing protein [Leptospiraceae bacterium]